MQHERLVSQKELKSQFGIPYTRVTLWRLEQIGKFPRRVTPSKRRVAWIASEITDYIDALKASRQASA
jgi:predicted DNA-binding transcriptional regulator AlpA